MNVKLIEITPNAEELIESAARVCYQSEPTEGYIKGTLIKKLLQSGHLSVFEHAYATFNISGVSRAMTHQLVRHRLVAYSQKSQRYVKEDQFDFVIPESIIAKGPDYIAMYKDHMAQIQVMYNWWKDHGFKNEDTRFLLPNACCTEIVMSANFREFLHVFQVRCNKHAQWEIRKVCFDMLDCLCAKAPNVFSKIYQETVQYRS